MAGMSWCYRAIIRLTPRKQLRPFHPTIQDVNPPLFPRQRINVGPRLLRTCKRRYGSSCHRAIPLTAGSPFSHLPPVSACIATGYLLTNRPRVRLFQHHRIQANWTWPKAKNAPHGLVATGLPSKRTEKVGDVVICFNLSARVERADFPVPKKSLLQIVDVSVAEPSVHWLKSPNQLEALGDTATRVFASLLQHFPNATRWHLFFAGPAPGAVKVGQQLNPTMTPPTQLYEFNRAANPRYAPSILLTPPEPP